MHAEFALRVTDQVLAGKLPIALELPTAKSHSAPATWPRTFRMAHGWGMSVDDLHRCVDEGLKMVNDDERITCDVPWLSSLNEGPRAGRPWLRRLQPIEAVES